VGILSQGRSLRAACFCREKERKATGSHDSFTWFACPACRPSAGALATGVPAILTTDQRGRLKGLLSKADTGSLYTPVILLHGWEGSSASGHVVRVTEVLLDPAGGTG